MFCAYISIIGMLLPNILDFIVLEISRNIWTDRRTYRDKDGKIYIYTL